jgi:peptide chain release factor 2
MDDTKEAAFNLKKQVDAAYDQLKIDSLEQQHRLLKESSQSPEFWGDNMKAQDTMRQLSSLEQKIKPWAKLKLAAKELVDLLELNDESLKVELKDQLHKLQLKFNELKQVLKFNGPYDSRGAIVSIYSGAGGTDAQDWTQMLFRMYSRWFDKNDWKVKVIEESAGEEAGLKSITLEVDGDNVFGKLKGEHGVHRLVRLSPYNADNLRQTSFAKVEVMPKVSQDSELDIDNKDLKIDVYRSGGHGGQSVNTTDSAVRITHLPTGIVVSIQNERSQLQNRETAMTILRSRLTQLKLEQHKEKLSELKGPSQSAEWGNQIRSYVLHPYKQVKDLRTKYETSDPDSVLDGELDKFVEAYLEYSLSQSS